MVGGVNVGDSEENVRVECFRQRLLPLVFLFLRRPRRRFLGLGLLLSSHSVFSAVVKS